MKHVSLVILLFLSAASFAQEVDSSAVAPVIRQLEAYNNRDIDAFVSCYSDSVKVYAFPDIIRYEGKEMFRARYEGMFERNPDLHCDLVNRMVLGNTVIDEERVVFDKSRPEVHAIAIYKVENGLITEVRFVSGR